MPGNRLPPAPGNPLAGLDQPRVKLGGGPTPVHRLDLNGDGPPVWLKDDGLYGPYGGNKTRKLEWLLGEARRRGAQTVMTGGAIGTNHGLATALYARDLGMRCVLVLVPQPSDGHVSRQLERIRDSGAEVHHAGGLARGIGRGAWLLAGETARRSSKGYSRLPFLIPPGGSTPLGCIGYVEAGLELSRQVRAGELPEPSHVVVAVGTGGTAAGLALGLRLGGLRSRLICILVNDVTPVSGAGIARLANRTGRRLRRAGARAPAVVIEPGDIDLRRSWLGEGYGHETAAGAEALALFSEAGEQLEPVYTAKAAAALLALRRNGELGDGPLLFWQTYGALA